MTVVKYGVAYIGTIALVFVIPLTVTYLLCCILSTHCNKIEYIMKLSGNEPWVIAGTEGSIIWASKYTDDWWPIFEVDLDTGLIKIDVCGQTEIWHLSECSKLRIEDYIIIEQEGFCDDY